MTRSSPLVRTTRLVAGGVLLSLGLVGLALPVLPGWLFIIPGLSLWSTEFVWAAKLRSRASDQWDRLRDRTDGRPDDERREDAA